MEHTQYPLENARIVAFARLLGVHGDDKTIIDNFKRFYLDATQSLSEPHKQPPLFMRPC